MALPIDLVLVRHGQSEGNLANSYARRNDESLFTDEFKARHNSSWRLTDAGIEQAKAAGAWIRENLGSQFDRYCTSEYRRAMETSYHLGLEGAEWYADFLLRERDDGELDALPPSERLERYAEYMRRRGIDSFYAAPPGGESMAHLCLRLKWVLDTLHRECENKRVIIVCHGEVMWGFRILIERIPQHRFLKLREYTDPRYQMHNCQIIHYTRRDPSGSGEAVTPYVKWVRSVCPWNETLSSTGWQTIERPRYSNDDLRELVEQTPRLVNA